MSRDPAPDDDTGPRRARELFARASAGLDHGMAFRLRRARAQAQSAPLPRRFAQFSGLWPAGAAAAAMLVLAVFWWRPETAPAPAPTIAALDLPAPAAAISEQQEIELLLASDEDPELYAWLADAPVAIGGEMN